MNDENLEQYLYDQLNQLLDKHLPHDEFQEELGKLYMNAANAISAIYLINNEDQTKETLKMMGMEKQILDFKSLFKNAWFAYTNIAIWIEYLHNLYDQLDVNHPQYGFYTQIIDSVKMIENQMGINASHLMN